MSNFVNKFPCTQCGCCCKSIGKIKELSFVDFPYKADSNGICEMLTEDNKCKVYDSRPTICNIKKLAKTLGIPTYRFYKENIKECNKMITESGLPDKYKIKSYNNLKTK